MYKLASPGGTSLAPDPDEIQRRKKLAEALGAAGKSAGDKAAAGPKEYEENQLLTSAKKRIDSKLNEKRRQSIIKSF